MRRLCPRLVRVTIDVDLNPRPVAVRTADGEATGELRPSRDAHGVWTMELALGETVLLGSGHSCFASLRDLRLNTDRRGWLLGLNGARPNAVVSGMQADMGEGRTMYLVVPGQAGRPTVVRTLDPAPLDETSTVDVQDMTRDEWTNSRGRVD